MSALFLRLLRSASYRLQRIADLIDPPPPPSPPPPPPPPPPSPPKSEKEFAHERWVADQGDATLRQRYSLSDGDVVVDLGGYEGQWSSDIFSRYLCIIHVFEPVPHFAQAISERFAGNPKISVHPFAAGARNENMDISLAADASSVHANVGEALRIEIRDFQQWCSEYHVREIALLKINIEGGEYDLLEHLIDTGFIMNVRNIQVQFHDFVPNAEARMIRIQERLAATHELGYYYKFVWENWSRKV